MNTLYRFVDAAQHSGITDRLGWILLHSLWIDTAVAAALAASLWALRGSKPNVRYAAGCVAMVLMVALPIAAAFVVRPARPAAAFALTAPRSPMRAPALPVLVVPAVAPADLSVFDPPAFSPPPLSLVYSFNLIASLPPPCSRRWHSSLR